VNTAQTTSDEQKALWNGTAGQAWVDAQALLDQMFRPFEELLAATVRARAATSVLDIGCGTGSTTLAAARLTGTKGHCMGIDISEPMIDMAKARAKQENSPARFVVADAQSHSFEPASFDLIVSRFGVMFFSNPVQAFANLNSAARRNAELCLVTWRHASENPFMTTAERAAAPLLPDMPARKPHGPGQFAFADPDLVHQILDDSGWTEVKLQPVDFECSFPASGLMPYLTRLGPLGVFLQQTDEPTRKRVTETVRQAFEPYVRNEEVRFNAACWVTSARKEQ
jgi:SAM-dependent methyltransferase